MKRAALDVVAPENRQKYRTQVQAGFATYTNVYIGDEGGSLQSPATASKGVATAAKQCPLGTAKYRRVRLGVW